MAKRSSSGPGPADDLRKHKAGSDLATALRLQSKAINARRVEQVQVAGQEGDGLCKQQSAVEFQVLSILENITDAFFALDRHWRFAYLNPQSEKLLDRAPGDLLGKRIWDEYPGLLGSAFEPFYRRAMAEGVAGTLTSFYPDHDRFYEVRSYPTPTGISIYFRDVSERERAVAVLRQSEERLRALVTASSDAIYRMSPDWSEMLQLRSGGFINDTLQSNHNWCAEYITPEDRLLVREAFEAAIRVKGVFELEHRVCRVDGTLGWTLSRAVPVLGIDGEIVEWFGAASDVTARKNAEADRERLLDSERAARAEAERTSRIKDEFLATLSHVLRTPLNAILGWSHVLAGGIRDEADLTEGLAAIQRNARAQTRIIEDLLDMSSIISGKVRLDVQRVDLAAVVRESVATAKPSAETKAIRLHTVLDPNAGPVSGDPARLQQVMWNLLSNAVKFTPKGGRIQVLLERVNSHVEISVIDTGEGIEPDFLPHVFDRFRQADATSTRRHGGLGLGLSIVKQLVELHGGSLRVTSAGIGQGTTCAVSLAMTAIQSQPDPDVERHHPCVSSSMTVPLDAYVQIAGVKVLVVDDEADARALVRRLLEDCHAQVVTAGSAAEAVELVRAERPDVLVCDIGMPGEDGYSLIRRVRALGPEQGGQVPSAALTAYARAEDRVKAILAGFQMHLAKPVEPAELIATVAGLAGRTGMANESVDKDE